MLYTIGITVEGLHDMILDQRKEGYEPAAVLLHPLDAREMQEDHIRLAAEKADGAEEIVPGTICIIAGVMILDDVHVPRGTCWIVDRQSNPITRAV